MVLAALQVYIFTKKKMIFLRRISYSLEPVKKYTIDEGLEFGSLVRWETVGEARNGKGQLSSSD